MKPVRVCTSAGILAATIAGFSACGGSSGGGGTVDSGLPGSKPVAELTDDEARQLCEAQVEAARATVTEQQYCTFFNFVQAVTVDEQGNISIDTEACEAARDACVGSGEYPQGSACESSMAAQYSGCTATVGEIEGCATARMRQMRGLMSRISCSRVPTAEDFADYAQMGDPEACADLDLACPGI